MAKIKLSPLVNKIQGSAGPLLFSSSRGVATVRTKKTPVNPNTAPQQAARAAFRDLMSIWSQFHFQLQNAWTAYGATRDMTGGNAFISLSMQGELAGGIWSPSPPGAMPSLTVVGDVNGTCPGNAITNMSPGSISASFYLVYYHRMGNQGDPVPPVMTRGVRAGPTISPTNIALVDCEDGDNWVYCYIENADFTDWSLGFGALVVL